MRSRKKNACLQSHQQYATTGRRKVVETVKAMTTTKMALNKLYYSYMKWRAQYSDTDGLCWN